MLSLKQVKAHNGEWFSRKNKRFFGDIRYWTKQGKISCHTYLIRSTFAWTDMFDHEKSLHYRINPINPDTFEIEPLIDGIFPSIHSINEWLKTH